MTPELWSFYLLLCLFWSRIYVPSIPNKTFCFRCENWKVVPTQKNIYSVWIFIWVYVIPFANVDMYSLLCCGWFGHHGSPWFTDRWVSRALSADWNMFPLIEIRLSSIASLIRLSSMTYRCLLWVLSPKKKNVKLSIAKQFSIRFYPKNIVHRPHPTCHVQGYTPLTHQWKKWRRTALMPRPQLKRCFTSGSIIANNNGLFSKLEPKDTNWFHQQRLWRKNSSYNWEVIVELPFF